MGFFSLISGHDEENYLAGLEADRKRMELNRKKQDQIEAATKYGESWYDEDRYGPNWFKATVDNDARSSGIADGTGRTPEEFIEEGFDEGFDEGATAIRSTIGSAVSAVALTPLKLIPWNLWLILGVVAFFYFGGLKFVMGKAKG
jgi:hypothetical protein